MCLVAKPIVDGIENELTGTAEVIRLDANSALGRELSQRFGIAGLPTLLVIDGAGGVIYRQSGPPAKDKVLAAVGAAGN